MSIHVQRKEYDPEAGRYQYHLQFKPIIEDDEVHSSVSVEVAFSISENGDLADLSFLVPKGVRREQALKFLEEEQSAQVQDARVFIVLPEATGDSVMRAPADLELDAAGRIIGMEIH